MITTADADRLVDALPAAVREFLAQEKSQRRPTAEKFQSANLRFDRSSPPTPGKFPKFGNSPRRPRSEESQNEILRDSPRPATAGRTGNFAGPPPAGLLTAAEAAARPRRPRRPTLARAVAEARKAGVPLARVEINGIVYVLGEPELTESVNPWLEEMKKNEPH
jgi:hypothetical protein